MKLKASEIVLIIAAVAILALLGYNLMKSGESTAEPQKEMRAGEKGDRGNAELEAKFPDDPDELRKFLRGADRDLTLDFMRMVRERGLPDNYEFPEFLLTAGSAKESAKRIGDRYPEFYGKGGNALIEAAAKYPVKYMAMIEESLAYRQLYRPTSEVEAEEQAEAARRMREELARERAEKERAEQAE